MKIIEILIGHKPKQLFAGIETNNIASIFCFERVGFKKIGIKDGIIEYKYDLKETI